MLTCDLIIYSGPAINYLIIPLRFHYIISYLFWEQQYTIDLWIYAMWNILRNISRISIMDCWKKNKLFGNQTSQWSIFNLQILIGNVKHLQNLQNLVVKLHFLRLFMLTIINAKIIYRQIDPGNAMLSFHHLPLFMLTIINAKIQETFRNKIDPGNDGGAMAP